MLRYWTCVVPLSLLLLTNLNACASLDDDSGSGGGDSSSGSEPSDERGDRPNGPSDDEPAFEDPGLGDDGGDGSQGSQPDDGTTGDDGGSAGGDGGSGGDDGGTGGGDGGTGGDDGGTGGDDGGSGGDDGGTGGDDGGTGGDDGGTGGDDGGGTGVQPGGACSCDADCATVDGHDGVCVFGVCMNAASSACSAGGSSAECPGGSRCWGLEGVDGALCWPDCDAFACAGGCDSDGSCVPGEGMDCNSACGELCSGGGGDGGGPTISGEIGSACSSPDQCGDGQCQAESADNGWLDGYCLAFGCSTPGAGCGDGGICVEGLATDGSNVCMQNCAGGCREGYECLAYGEQTFCFPYCEQTSDCGSGFQCVDQICVDGRPCAADNPDGVCPGGLTCLDGECRSACSPSNPDGYCWGDFVCEGGECLSPHGCGTWECDGPDCHDIVLVPGSQDPNSAQALASGFYLAHELRYSYLRQDLSNTVQWAACETRAHFPGLPPIGLGDLSQADGRTPGTDMGPGQERHMTSTHRGDDLDIAYLQTDGDNNPQIICGDGSDNNPNGYPGNYNDGEFCTTESNIVNVEQTVYFLAMMAHNPDYRVTGIDQTLPDDFAAEAQRLYNDGVISADTYERLQSWGYGAEGYWQFHHHHMHVSYYR